MTDYATGYYWEAVSGAHDAAAHTASLTRGKVAVAQYWPFLAHAESEEDFVNRLEIVSNKIEAAVGTETYDEVVKSLRDDFRAVYEASRSSANSTSPELAEFNTGLASHQAELSDPEFFNASTGKWERAASYYDRAKPENYHHSDGEEKYDLGYQHGHAGKRPVYTGHEDYLIGHRDGRSDREVEDQYGYPTSQRMATNYQRDPNADWRYYAPYQQLQLPPQNLDSQDSDGFPIDLAQGENRSQPKLEADTQPGEWVPVPGTAMPERPMPFSQERGYVPIASRRADLDDFVGHERAYWRMGHTHANEGVAPRQRTLPGWAHEAYVDGYTHGYAGRHRQDSESHDVYADYARDPYQTTASFDRDGFLVSSVRHTAPGGGEHAPYRIKEEGGRFYVENDKGERKEEKGYATREEARQHQKALYANVPGAAESAKEDEEKKGKTSSRVVADYQYVKKRGDKWVITQKGTGKVLSEHDSEEEAKASFRAMMSNKHGSKEAANYVNRPEPRHDEKEACSQCGGQGYIDARTFGESGWHPCYHCGTTGEVNAHDEWEDREHARGHGHGLKGIPPEREASNAYLEGHQKGYHENRHVHYPDYYSIKREGEPDYDSPKEQEFARNHPEFLDEGVNQKNYRQATRQVFDKDGFLVEAADVNQQSEDWGGRANSPLVDPPPGAPQKVNPFYFNPEGEMGANDGFPAQPVADPMDRVNEIYAENGGPAQSVQDTSSSSDGKGYSRSHPGESPNFNSTASNTDGKIVDHCPGCDKPRRVHSTPHGDEVRHIHNNHVRCFGSKTAGDYLGRPDARNPTGRGEDEYDANTWDAYQRTRPFQSPEDRHINTPVMPQEPIKTGPNVNTPIPGAENNREEEDDENESDD